MSSLVLTIKSAEADDLKGSTAIESIQDINNHLTALAAGMAKGIVYAQSSADDPVAASATWTLNTVIATDTVTIGTITFTGTATPTTNLHFDTGAGSDTLIAASIAAAVNAHPTTSQIVTASSAAAVVTVTAKVRGVVGNFIPISDADTTITTSAAFLAGGTGGVTDAEATYNFGE